MSTSSFRSLIKRTLATCVLFAGLSAVAFAASAPLTVGSFNVRYKNTSDGPNNWEHRKDMVVGVIVSHGWEVFGMQEPTAKQMKDIEKALPKFGWVGVGRDDGKEKGEYSPVFYSRDRFDLLESGFFWLSDTPEKPSRGWDAACNRTCAWTRLKDKVSGKVFVFANTHLDHKGDEARKQGANLVIERLNKIAKSDEAIFLTGDFNARPDSVPYKFIVGHLTDSKSISQAKPTGPVGTFNGFKWEGPFTATIDYIFVKPGVKVLKHSVLTDSKDNRWPSDHFPLMAVVELP